MSATSPATPSEIAQPKSYVDNARLGILRRHDLPLVPVMTTLLGLAPGELDEMHPFMTLLQTLADPIDPGSYARYYWQPLPRHRMQSVTGST